MNEPEELGGEVHPVATLLPWYLSGTLKEDERQQVVQHLERCQACREELEELTTLRTQLKPVFSELPGSSPQLHQAVMEKIHAQEGRARSGAVIARVLDSVELWSRSLYRPRWVPTLMLIIVLGQFGMLLWFAGRQTTSSGDGVISRGLPAPTARIRVAFQGTAPEDKVRSVIMQLRGRIVDGPSAEGFYTIELSGDEAKAVEVRLENLRAQREVIRAAERVKS